jgi:hypothetical protein
MSNIIGEAAPLNIRQRPRQAIQPPITNDNFKYTSLEEAVYAGDTDEFIRMHQAGFTGTFDIFLAGFNPQLELLKYLNENGWPIENDRTISSLLAEKGAYDCLEYVFQEGALNTSLTLNSAYKSQNLKCFQLCVDHLSSQFVSSNDKEHFWCPAYEWQPLVDAINLDEANWRPLLHIDLKVDDWKALWLENNMGELVEWPLLTPKINEKKLRIQLDQEYCLYVTLPYVHEDVVKTIIQSYF